MNHDSPKPTNTKLNAALAMFYDTLEQLQKQEIDRAKSGRGLLLSVPTVHGLLDAERNGASEAVSEAMMNYLAADGLEHSLSFVHAAFQAFCRRSGLYKATLALGQVDREYYTKILYKSLDLRTHKITYLAPINYLRVDSQSIKTESLEIRRFEHQELNNCLENEDRIGYGRSIPTDVLHQFNFLVLESINSIESPIPDWSKTRIDSEDVYRVKDYPHAFPESIELALRRLLLFNWERFPLFSSNLTGSPEKQHWIKFGLPFVITLDDNLFCPPRPAPNMSNLSVLWDTSPIGQEQQVPFVAIEVGDEYLTELREFLSSNDESITRLSRYVAAFPYLEIALQYLVKAYFCPSMDSILWHIVVMEALVGSRYGPKSDKVAERVSRLIAESDGESKKIKKQIRELYNVRNSLVHGSHISQQVFTGHLLRARSFARRTTLWFLNFLKWLVETYEFHGNQNPLPSQDELLRLIDLSAGERHQMHLLTQSVPRDFPRNPIWCK